METVIVEDLQTTLILYAQWPGLATVKQDRPNRRLVDAAFCSAPRLQRGMQSIEGRTRKVDPHFDFTNDLPDRSEGRSKVLERRGFLQRYTIQGDRTTA